MKISNEQAQKILQEYMRQVENKKAEKVKPSDQKAGDLKPGTESTRSDTVSITARSEEVKKAKKVYDRIPEVREDLVNDLKEKIKSGEYHVSAKDVAEKIIHRVIVNKQV